MGYFITLMSDDLNLPLQRYNVNQLNIKITEALTNTTYHNGLLTILFSTLPNKGLYNSCQSRCIDPMVNSSIRYTHY